MTQMSRFFILTTDALTTEQEQQVVQIATQFSWWHWMPNFWLFKDHSDTATVEAIRDQFGKVAPMSRCMIFQVNPVLWAGRVRPDAQGNKMEEWVNSHWKLP